MAATLSHLLQGIGAIVDQDTALPSGTDLSVRVNLIDQALGEWAHTYQWAQLRVPRFAPTITLSQVSIGLPQNFRKLMSRPFNMALTTGNDYEEVRPEEYYSRLSQDSNSRFCTVTGDRSIGYSLLINPALASGASLLFDYQMYPSSMATLQDVSVCPSGNFLIKRAISKIFESRSDPRFPSFKAEADDSLSNMMEEEAALSGAFTNQTKTFYDKYNFRVGDS